ncbi:MAG: hypothetical protein ACLFVP_07365 [Candidatus Bathyarchaeia archaeon]
MSSLGLVIAGAIIINTGYTATNIYDVPGVISVIVIPCAVVMCIGWFQRSIKRTMILTFAIILISGTLLQLTLSTPALLGVIQDKEYQQLFMYSAFMRVGRYMIITSFFAVLTAIVAGLSYE